MAVGFVAKREIHQKWLLLPNDTAAAVIVWGVSSIAVIRQTLCAGSHYASSTTLALYYDLCVLIRGAKKQRNHNS